jgi:hypothetical protein
VGLIQPALLSVPIRMSVDFMQEEHFELPPERAARLPAG